jgi:hypothetical protein
MATHHVTLRRACPAPQDLACIAGRATLRRIQPDSNARHLIQSALMLLPTETTYRGTPRNIIELGRCKVS